MSKEQKEKLLNLKHARDPKQHEIMQHLLEEGICPFCYEHFVTYHREPIEKEGKYWLITKNDFPYEGSSAHYLLIFKDHITDLSDISSDAWKEFGEYAKYLREKIETPGASLFMRFGDTNYTGGTIDHLHAHLIAGGNEDEAKEKLKVNLGYKKRPLTP
jgi:diadenosine tetraphosphate (Ap4A) HIT family hydrolase